MPELKLQLKKAKGDSYYCSGVFSIGVYVKNNIATLIDTGIDDNIAKKVIEAIENAGYTVGAIINTHSHADHCGGNNRFQKKYPNVKIYSTQFEKAFIESPYLEPMSFSNAASPFSELTVKHLQAQASVVTNIITPYKDQTITINDTNFRIITLPGHTPGSIGVITPDNILYCGDAFFGEETLKKHPVLFYTNISDSLASFRKLSELQIDGCVMYHGGAVPEIKSIIEAHVQRLLSLENTILEWLKNESFTLDTLTQKVMQTYQIPNNVLQFTLIKTCVMAHVSQLQSEKEVDLKVKDGLLKVSASEIYPRLEPIITHATPEDDLHALSSYQMTENDDKNLQLTIYFKENNFLSGASHWDMQSLNAIQYILDLLRGKGFAAKENVIVSSPELTAYNSVNLPYKDKNFIQPEGLKPNKTCIQRVMIYPNRFEIKMGPDVSQWDTNYSILCKELEKLGLNNNIVIPQTRMARYT